MKSTLAVVVLVLIAASAGFLLPRVLELTSPEVAERVAAGADCDLRQGPCEVRFGNGLSASLSLAPRENIRALAPLRISARFSRPVSAPVQVQFVGLNMDMGFNLVTLAAAGDGGRVYEGRGLLPACSVSRMEWAAELRASEDGDIREAVFRFDTTRQ